MHATHPYGTVRGGLPARPTSSGGAHALTGPGLVGGHAVQSHVNIGAPTHSGVGGIHGLAAHHGSSHSSSAGAHGSSGLHQEPFHGYHIPHHDAHHELHHDGHLWIAPFVRYAAYPRYSYASDYCSPYAGPVFYPPPTVVVAEPAVRYSDPVPVPPEPDGLVGDAPEGRPSAGSSSVPRDAHGMDSPPVLRAPLVETKEAPEQLPLPKPDKPEPK